LKISLKYKFLIPTLIIVIAGMVTISAISHFKAKAALSKMIVNEIENIALTTANSMDLWINNRKIDLDNWSKQGVYKTALMSSFLGLTARDFANEQLKKIKQDYKYYYSIALSDAAGNVIAASDKSIINNLNVSGRDYFKKALEGRTYVSEHLIKSLVTNKNVFIISSPIKDNNRILGVLFALFEVNTFAGKFIHKIRIGKNGYAYIFMDNGLISTQPEKTDLFGHNINEFDFGRKMLATSEAGFTEYELKGQSFLASHKKIKSIDCTLVVCAVKNEIFAPVKDLWRINFFVTITIVIGVTLVLFLITGSVSRPLKEIVSGLQKMGEGHLDFRLSGYGNDEVGEIDQALNKMAENLEQSNLKIKQQTALLENARDDLELRVQERTLELKKTEKKYRNIFENAVEGIFQIGLDGSIINANPSLARILGYGSEKELLSNKVQLLLPIPQKEMEELVQLMEKEEEIIGYETRLYGKDKNQFWCSISARKIRNRLGDINYYEGFIVDISERKEMEDATIKRKTAEASNLAKSEFLANMSHEIRTPLNAILGFSDLLSRDAADPKQKSYTDAINIAGKSLLTLINDILDLSKIEAGMMDIFYEPVSLSILFQEIEHVFREKITGKKLKFILDLDNSLPLYLSLDESRVRQILLNLVGNAVKFTEKGHIKLMATMKPASKADTIDLNLVVEDSGPGIASDNIDRIFDCFTQVDPHLKKDYGGTGLGLSICKRLTQAMNGEIFVTSTPGLGSSFKVCLKDVKVSLESDLEGKQKPNSTSYDSFIFEKGKVLVVDDVEFNRYLMKELLLKLNQDVLEAKDGKEAVSMVKEHAPDLIIMDIRMPGMDGNEATVKLKADPETKNIPIIALTGDILSTTREEIMGKGYDGYLTKPAKIDELLTELSKYLAHTILESKEKKPASFLNVFVKKNILNPELLMHGLDRDILPQCKLFENSIMMTQLQQFAEQLLDLALEHKALPLIQFGKDLINNIAVFDIVRINENIAELPGLIKAIGERLGEKN